MKKIVVERPDDFKDLSTVIPDVVVDLKYYTGDNFVGQRIDGYEAPIALLTGKTADALKLVQDKLRKKGFGLKIYDGYRPIRAVKYFFDWGLEKENGVTKEEYYPDLTRQEIFEQGFIASPSAHTRGSTVDLTIIDLKNNQEVDMGGAFDFFSPVSFYDYQNLSKSQIKNRKWLRELMELEGFCPFDSEWWHFTLKNEPYPDTYFNFPVV